MSAAWSAGTARTDITPPLGVEMCGYGPYEKRVCTEVLDRLYARALWLECGGEAAALVTMDVCTVDAEVRQAAARAIGAAGLPPERLMLCASHTHSGPAVQRMIGWGERDPAYMAALPERLAAVALEAREQAVPARLGAKRARISHVGYNREQPELGPVDTAAQLLRVDRLDGAPMAVVYNYGAHAVVRYPFTSRLSADWPGLVGAALQRGLQGAETLFLQGPCGNINANYMTFQRDDLEAGQEICDRRTADVAQRFAEQVLPALSEMETVSEGEISGAFRTIQLPCVPPDRHELEARIARDGAAADAMTLDALRPLHARLPDETEEEKAWRRARFDVEAARRQLELLDEGRQDCPAFVQALRLGDAVLVGWPAEVFVELGIEFRQRSPFPLTFVASFANDTVGYIPTPAAYESRGRDNEFGVYPRDRTPLIYGRLPFRSDVGPVLVEQTLELISGL